VLGLTPIQLALVEHLCYTPDMVRIHYFRAHIARALADALNAESGRAYTDALVRHWRVYRRHGHWLSRKAASKLQDTEFGSAILLHSHSLDAAREGFYNACKTARECRKQGLDNKYPYKRKRFRPTVWKNTAIRKDGDTLLLSMARENAPIRVRLSDGLCNLPADAFREVKLVYDRSGWYEWHVAVEDGREPEDAPGDRVVAVDPGAYFTYKVEEFGVEVELQNEAYTTRTCPGCEHEHKPRGQVYACPVCGLRAHRDAVGAANILSLYLRGEMGHIQPTEPKYRQPFRKSCPERELQARGQRERPRRSPEDTGQVAAAGRPAASQ
jgi:hypothetical protein